MPSLAQASKQIGCDSIILNIERLKKKNEKKMEKKMKKKMKFFFQFFFIFFHFFFQSLNSQYDAIATYLFWCLRKRWHLMQSFNPTNISIHIEWWEIEKKNEKKKWKKKLKKKLKKKFPFFFLVFFFNFFFSVFFSIFFFF